MVESPAGGLHTRPTTQTALRAAPKAEEGGRNLPRTTAKTAHRDPVDWNSFRELYYPDSRRHNFEAIVAYGAYRRHSWPHSPASELARPK